jgi:hypothetical protein
LHAAQLLSDDETYKLEDLVADCLALGPVTQVSEATSRLVALVNLSEGIVADAGFARQLRRKYA